MFTISKRGDYGLELLTLLAKKGQDAVVPLRRLTQKSHLPYRFASQLAVSLKAAGILGSKEGLRGGYFLAKNPDKISVSEVIRALEGHEGLVRCLREGICKRKDICSARPVWDKIQEDISRIMTNYTLADLVKRKEMRESYVGA